jgi:hypothetical protein
VHLDTFAWIGAFSSAPNTRPPAELVPDPAAAKAKLKLLYLHASRPRTRITTDGHFRQVGCDVLPATRPRLNA